MASKTWMLHEQLKDKLNSFGSNCYRIMLGIKRIDKIPNKTFYETVEQEPLSVKVARRQLTWIGHMIRRNDESPINTYGLYEPSIQMGKNIRGKPKLSYRKQIVQLLNPIIDLSAIEIQRMAQDRAEWKKLVIVRTSGSYGYPNVSPIRSIMMT